MPLYKVQVNFGGWRDYLIEADDEDEARELVYRGDGDVQDEGETDLEVADVELLDDEDDNDDEDDEDDKDNEDEDISDWLEENESLRGEKEMKKIRIRAVEAEEAGEKTNRYEVIVSYLGEVTWEDTYIVEAEDEDEAEELVLDGDYIDSIEGDWRSGDEPNIIDTEIKSIERVKTDKLK